MFAGFRRLETKPQFEYMYILCIDVIITDNFW